MRIFNKDNRMYLSEQTERIMFEAELDYYRNNNQYPVILFGHPITNIYKNINIQVIISKACNFRCGFCIENDRITSKTKEIDPSGLLKTVLQQYTAQGIFPNISITGGEPTLFEDRLNNVLNTALKYTKKVSVNTNGSDLSLLKSSGVAVNVSRHHYDPDRIKELFMSKSVPTLEIFPKLVLQCVMMKDGINSIVEMKNYMDFYNSLGVSGFSFRGLTNLDAEKQYADEILFSENQAVDFLDICNQIAADDEFEFIQQKIGDHYLYEFYKYRGSFVRLTYSNFKLLREFESEERKNNQWFSRATIVHPHGKVYAGWTYDINEIFAL